jgi:hypothetical protein
VGAAIGGAGCGATMVFSASRDGATWRDVGLWCSGDFGCDSQPSILRDEDGVGWVLYTREWNRNFSRTQAKLDVHEPWNYRSVRRLTAPSLHAACPPARGSPSRAMGNLCWENSTVVLPVDGVDRFLHEPQLQPSAEAPPSVDCKCRLFCAHVFATLRACDT